MYTTFIYATFLLPSLSAIEAVIGLDVMHNYVSFPGFLYSSNYSQSVPTQIKKAGFLLEMLRKIKKR